MHRLGHPGTPERAGCKEEIHHRVLAVEHFVGDRFAIPVGERKLRNIKLRVQVLALRPQLNHRLHFTSTWFGLPKLHHRIHSEHNDCNCEQDQRAEYGSLGHDGV